jgi:hypothetical protein
MTLHWKRQLQDALLWLLAAILLLWLGDWAVWRIRVWHGGGYDTVQVSQFLLTPLKNHRMKADEQSTAGQALHPVHLSPRRRRSLLVAPPPRHRIPGRITSLK